MEELLVPCAGSQPLQRAQPLGEASSKAAHLAPSQATTTGALSQGRARLLASSPSLEQNSDGIWEHSWLPVTSVE